MAKVQNWEDFLDDDFEGEIPKKEKIKQERGEVEQYTKRPIPKKESPRTPKQK
jgi:hypothetical protein